MGLGRPPKLENTSPSNVGESGSKAGGAVAKRIACADVKSESNMFNFGSAMNAASTDDKTVSTAAPFSTAFFTDYKLTRDEAIITAQAQAMVYTKQKLSKSTLDDPYTKNVIYTAVEKKVRLCFPNYAPHLPLLPHSLFITTDQNADQEGPCAVRVLPN
jgi:hypothetical protein